MKCDCRALKKRALRRRAAGCRPPFPGAHARLRPARGGKARITQRARCSTPSASKLRNTHTAMGRAPPARSVGQGVADAFNLLVCAGSPVAVAGGASALVALPAFLLSALHGTMDGWVQL